MIIHKRFAKVGVCVCVRCKGIHVCTYAHLVYKHVYAEYKHIQVNFYKEGTH